MKHTLIALALFGLASAHAAAPVNDSILKAVTFTGNYQHIITPDVSTATAATTDPLNNGVSLGKTIWYRIPNNYGDTKPCHLQIKALTGAGVYAIYEALDPSNPLSSLRDTTPSPIAGTVNLSTSTGTARYLMIAGTGTFDVTWRKYATSGLENDFPALAYQLTGDHGTMSDDNASATLSADEPALPISMVNTLWYQWTPNASVNAFVDTSFSFIAGDVGDDTGAPVHDTVMVVYKGTPDALVEVASDNDSGWSTNSRVSFLSVPGVTYYIAVGTRSGAAPGGIQLHYHLSTVNPEFQFAPNSDRALDENGGGRPFTVRRIYASEVFNTVNVSTVAGGTATAGVDYTAISNQMLSFPFPSTGDGGWQQMFTFSPLNDTNDESNETVVLALSGASNGAVVGGSASALVTIADDEAEEGLNMGFVVDQRIVRLREGQVTSAQFNAVIRIGNNGASLPVVQYVTGGGNTAKLNEDFQLSNTSISAGENREVLTGTLVNDNLFEPEEKVTIGVAVSGGAGTYDLIIEDDDPYVPVSGKLVAGLLDKVRSTLVYATISGTGAVTGTLKLLDQTLSWKAQLNDRGKAVIPLLPTGRTIGMVLTLQALDAFGGFKVSLDDPFMGTQISEDVVLQNYSATLNPCPEAARCTFVGHGSGTAFECTSAGSLVVSTSGTAVFSGKLFDGTAFTAAGYVDGSGKVFAQAALYKNLGCVFWKGALPQSVNQVSTISAGILHPGRAGDLTGIGARFLGTGTTVCRYSPPATGQRALDCWSTGSGKATFSSGGVMMFAKTFTISTTHLIAVPVDANQVKLTLVPATGLFSGSFIPAGQTKALTIYGALIDLPATNGYGKGYFFNGQNAGSVTIGQP